VVNVGNDGDISDLHNVSSWNKRRLRRLGQRPVINSFAGNRLYWNNLSPANI